LAVRRGRWNGSCHSQRLSRCSASPFRGRSRRASPWVRPRGPCASSDSRSWLSRPRRCRPKGNTLILEVVATGAPRPDRMQACSIPAASDDLHCDPQIERGNRGPVYLPTRTLIYSSPEYVYLSISFSMSHIPMLVAALNIPSKIHD
jgi:hypothetical protein